MALSEDLSTYSNSDHELVAFLSLNDGIVYPVESDWITKVTGHVAEPDNEARKHSLCPEQHSLNGDEGLISGHPRMIILDMSIFRKRLARYCTEYKFSKCNIVFDIEWSQSLNRKLDLSKMINVFGVVELTLNIADFLDLRSIDALRQTSRHFRNMRTLATVGKLRVQKVLTRALGTHHPGVKQHVSDFNRILSATCSIVGGSTALAILSPGKWIPGDMDIVVQDKYADTMEAFLTETIGLVLNVEKSQSSGLYPGGQGPPVHNVHDRNHIKFAYRRFDSPKPDQPGVDLTIIHPRSYNAQRHCAEWVLTYHSTVVMNFWTGRKLCSLWPDLTLSGKLLRNEYTPTPRIEAALEKYHLRGFTDIHENGSPDEKRYLQDDYPQAKGERLSMELIPGPTWRKEIVLFQGAEKNLPCEGSMTVQIDENAPLLSNEAGESNGHGTFPSQQVPAVEQPRAQDHIASPQRSLLAIIIPMALGTFLVAMDSTIVVASYASIGNEMKQLDKTSWIATGYMLTLTSFQPLYGKLSDIFGRKSCLLIAYVIFALGCLFCGLARTMEELIVARALAGIGGGGMSTVVSIIMSDIIPLRSRGVWQGIINIVFATGSSVGAPLGGFLSDTIGWRWYVVLDCPLEPMMHLTRAFLIQVPAVLLAITSVSLALHLPDIEKSDFKVKIKRVDFVGAVILVTCIFFFLFGLDNGGNVSWSAKTTVLSLVASAVLFIGFGYVEMEWAKEPFAPKRIIFSKSLIASYLVNFFSIASSLSMLFHISLYLQAIAEMSPSRAGLFLVPGIIGGVTGSLGSGLIMRATGKYYWLTVFEYILLLIGSLTIILSSGVWMHSVAIIVVGGGITTSLISLISIAGHKDQAIATAVSYLFRSMGSVVGLSVGSTILQDVLRSDLRRRLTGKDTDEIVKRVRESLDYLNQLDQETRTIVLGSYEDAIHTTMWFCFSMAVCAAAASLFIREKPLSGR
ncbi:hypothetical protein D9757_003893 [Collybiopsis confluens]|uniref:Major facilitator superfamily (MFS) profile domain-containing protein n=1 Tax=Collybiopsis confluens TaxID=2823264 RepID=A0A8H5HUY6_9AGAR|nr:hypothetical protein D9757_003893 [Collybiopsis confluens]